jgi:hypothetical protein
MSFLPLNKLEKIFLKKFLKIFIAMLYFRKKGLLSFLCCTTHDYYFTYISPGTPVGPLIGPGLILFPGWGCIGGFLGTL